MFRYLCCDCDKLTQVEGLEALPDPPRCLPCHLMAVIEEEAVRKWLAWVRRPEPDAPLRVTFEYRCARCGQCRVRRDSPDLTPVCEACQRSATPAPGYAVCPVIPPPKPVKELISW